MVPSPPVWAVLGDVWLCLGAGLLLGALRDAADLALGSGTVRCFVLDVMSFCAAAFVCCGFAAGASSSGTARWYMAAALAAGVLCWRYTVSRALRYAARTAVRHTLGPLQKAVCGLVRPVSQRMRARAEALRSKKQNKCARKKKKTKNVLQKEDEILYNG